MIRRFLVLRLERHDHSGGTDVMALLDEGAKIDAKNVKGETALHRAAYGGQYDSSRLLVARKAHLDAKDSEGNTALYLAVTIRPERHTVRASLK